MYTIREGPTTNQWYIRDSDGKLVAIEATKKAATRTVERLRHSSKKRARRFR